MRCVLCTYEAVKFFTEDTLDYYHCSNCDLRFLNPNKHLTAKDELERYQLHENNVEDVRYQNYLKPIFDWVTQNSKPRSYGLDFGCGEGPLLAQMLNKADYRISLYDPYFYPEKSYINNQYDFIVSTEAAEHFYNPLKEFTHLRSLLKPKGGLGIVTALYDKKIDFESWYYRRDPTHVSFYSKETFEWIKSKFDFKSYKTDHIRLNWLEAP